MGYHIKHKKGKWNAISGISDEKLLDKSGSIEDIKKAFMEIAIDKMVEKLIEIEMDFPNGYSVNDQRFYRTEEGAKFNKWYLDILQSEKWEEMDKMYEGIKKKYNLEI